MSFHFSSRELLEPLINCDLSNDAFPYGTSRIVKLAGHQIRAMRTSFVGELGWELHVPMHACLPVYLAIWEQGRKFGLRHAGFRALYSLCSEKGDYDFELKNLKSIKINIIFKCLHIYTGYRLWNSDVRVEDNPVEAGLDHTCRSDGEYLGKEAVQDALNNGIKKRHVFVTISE